MHGQLTSPHCGIAFIVQIREVRVIVIRVDPCYLHSTQKTIVTSIYIVGIIPILIFKFVIEMGTYIFMCTWGTR